jgi:ATP-dependent Clp protease ATP-binding subunit ClpC
MEAKFSQRVKDVLSYSREEALRLGNDYIGLEHILLGILREGEGLAVQLMKYFGMDLNEVRKMIEKAVANP